MPLLSLRGRPEVRLGGFASLAGGHAGRVLGAGGDGCAAEPQAAAAVPEPDRSEPEAPATTAETAEPDSTAGPSDDLDAMLAGLSAPPPAVPDTADAVGGRSR